MKRQSKTTLGELRIGDRFYFISDKGEPIVREVTAISGEKVKYNRIKHPSGKHIWWWDRKQSASREVMFIRHTILLGGDQCFMQDLKEGDVFTRPGSDKEMRRGAIMKDGQVLVRYVGQTSWLHTSPLTTGIFIRKASLKTKPTNGAVKK